MKLKTSLIFLTLVLSNVAFAKDLGEYGSSYEIKEHDLLEEIYDKLKNYEASGELAEHQQNVAKKFREYIARPKPVEGIQKAVENKIRNYDPTITINEDIEAEEGRVILAGTAVNPLDYTSFDEEWLFIDGDDQSQLKFARVTSEKKENTKIILTKGNPGTQIQDGKELYYYFDQFGHYCKKFGINKVPSILRQSIKNPKLMEIEEVYLNEKLSSN